MLEVEQSKNKAHLFTLRVWATHEKGTALQWRSRLQNINSGEVIFCRDWENLIANIEEMLCQENNNSIESKEKPA